MSGIDLTEAVKAASAAIFIRWNEWRSDADRKAALAVEAALPIIEAAVREKVAAEIEVLMRRFDGVQVGFSAVGDAYANAARIARNGAPS